MFFSRVEIDIPRFDNSLYPPPEFPFQPSVVGPKITPAEFNAAADVIRRWESSDSDYSMYIDSSGLKVSIPGELEDAASVFLPVLSLEAALKPHCFMNPLYDAITSAIDWHTDGEIRRYVM